jgi:hypothetical protein
MVWLLVVETPRASGTERSLGPAKLVAERRQLEAGGPPLLTGADGVVRHRRVFSSGECAAVRASFTGTDPAATANSSGCGVNLLGAFFEQAEAAMHRGIGRRRHLCDSRTSSSLSSSRLLCRHLGTERDRPMRFGAGWCQYW